MNLIPTIRANQYTQFPRLKQHWYVATDFEAGGVSTAGAGDWISQVSPGTGAAWAGGVPWATNVFGVAQLQLGTVATNSQCWRTNGSGMKFGGGAFKFRGRSLFHQLSNVTDTYSWRMGAIDSSTAESADAVMFRYAYTVNSGKFQCVSRAGNVETATATDSGVTVTVDTDYVFETAVNAAGTASLFYINGTQVGSHSANIPTAELGVGVMALRTVGTAACNPLSVDYMEAECILTTAR